MIICFFKYFFVTEPLGPRKNRQFQTRQWIQQGGHQEDGEHPEDPEREDGKWVRTEEKTSERLSEEGEKAR